MAYDDSHPEKWDRRKQKATPEEAHNMEGCSKSNPSKNSEGGELVKGLEDTKTNCGEPTRRIGYNVCR